MFTNQQPEQCNTVAQLVKQISSKQLNDQINAIINVTNVMSDAIFIVNEDAIFESINSSAATLFGFEANTLIGKKWHRFFYEDSPNEYHYIHGSKKAFFDNPQPHNPKEYRLRQPNGHDLHIELSISCLPTLINSETPLYIGIMRNISKHIEKHNQLTKQIERDNLTGLKNKAAFDKLIIRKWGEASVNKQPLSYLLIDIDQFKLFNNSFGYAKGDQCLQKMAKTIEHCMPFNECIVARYGGDKFAVILPRIEYDAAKTIAKHIQAHVNIINFRDIGLPPQIKITVSLGLVCESNQQYKTPVALMCAAEAELRKAKAKRNTARG
jgi:diguanylate cyclase (GGDEF)-like protein/PAS domain S-box-containing protein